MFLKKLSEVLVENGHKKTQFSCRMFWLKPNWNHSAECKHEEEEKEDGDVLTLQTGVQIEDQNKCFHFTC